MKASWSKVARVAEWCGVCVLVAVALPLIAATVLLLRGLLLIGVLVGIAAVGILCAVSPRIRHRIGHDPRNHHIHLRLL